jgi:L-fuculose-phosphate aldolase
MGDRKTYLIHQIVKYSQKLDAKGFGANHDGNISVKFEEVLLATPTAVSKGDIVPEMIITLDLAGKKIEGIGNPFSEIKLHLAAYRTRDDVKAVVHAHPPFATVYGLANRAIYPTLPEAMVSMGLVIPVVNFAMPGAKENDDIVHQALAKVDVFMMPGNGILAVGDTVEQAYLRIELAEHLAKIQFYADQLGSPMTLSETDRTTLLKKRVSLGLGPKTISPTTLDRSNGASIEALKIMITEEIKNILGDK